MIVCELFNISHAPNGHINRSFRAMSLISLAPEMLEEIAFYVATNPFLGPPSALIPLLSSCRTIYDSLSINSNDHLYAQIFTNKFDMEPPIRRLGSRITLSSLLASELRRRCIYLKRIKYRLDALTIRPPSTATEHDCDGVLRETLWMAYLMMLENDGKNEMQLREYAGMDGWLKLYWFNDDGASLAKHAIRIGQWPSNSRQASLAMWLFWFLLVPGESFFFDFVYIFNPFPSQEITETVRFVMRQMC